MATTSRVTTSRSATAKGPLTLHDPTKNVKIILKPDLEETTSPKCLALEQKIQDLENRYALLEARVDQLEALEEQAPFGQTIFQLRTIVAKSMGYLDYSGYLMKAKNFGGIDARREAFAKQVCKVASLTESQYKLLAGYIDGRSSVQHDDLAFERVIEELEPLPSTKSDFQIALLSAAVFVKAIYS